jgi:O-antigen ligase
MTEQFIPVKPPSSEPQVQEAATPWYSYVMPGALGAFYLLFLWLDFSYMNMTRWPWAPILSFGLLAAAGWGIWQLRRLSKPYRGLGNGLDWAALLWVIALVASTIFSHVPHRSHWYLTMALSYIAALYALSNWLDSKQKIENLTIFLVGSSLFFNCNSLYQYFFKKWLPLQGKNIDPGLMLNNFPLGHQSFVAGFLVLTLPVATGVAFYCKDWRRWLGIGTVLIGLWTMVSTGSRGGFLGLGVALAISLIFTLWIDWSWKKVKIGVAAVSSLLFLIAILRNLNGNFRYRTANIFSGQDLNVLSRLWAWEVGFKEWKANPIFGVGVGANPYTFEQYQHGMKQYPWSQMVFQQLHNSWVQVSAELGSLGGIAILVTVALLMWYGYRLYHANQLTALSVSIFCGLAGYGVMSLTDYQLELPAISMTLVILTALLTGFSHDLQDFNIWSDKIRKGSTLVGLASLALAIAVLAPVQRALYESEKGFEAYNRHDIPTFYSQLVKANYFNPNDPYYPLQISLVMQRQGLLAQSPKNQEEYYKRGAFWAEKAAKLMNITYTHENAGWAYVHLQKYQEAEKFFRDTLDIDSTPRNSAYLGLAASLLKQESKKEEGTEALAKYLFMNPQFFRDRIWEKGNSLPKYFPTATEKLSKIYDRLLTQYPGDIDLLYNKAMVHYVRGDYQNALFLLESIPQNPRPLKYVQGDGTTAFPYTLASTTLDKAKLCLKKERALTNIDKNKLPKSDDNNGKLVFPLYETVDHFMFRHAGGTPAQVIWPIFSDPSKFNCGIPNAGLTRLILPKN